ncbi:poly(ADP-ribose) polymerase family member 14-related sequence 1 isoform X2 [Callorhinchus milii]|uniref:poly(ADP-ribose) polymerase family member 14-related sequence 1 isoform X2 n=1 Tax=Callorhinchus milii TaxID=7868 RepID=UPI000457486F|nr:poly(ADP-ribose) polymerase family member 14-related sequence 1 isoform X2 [Callorhinchus milii]|eukprot:gi/632969731/ref/XP_007901242.1/ PREDICTED: poly [ADP-ribose] polymerase 14 [Callorhinchus milii]
MAEERVYAYPLCVEGDWDAGDAKLLKNKLQLYFQSPKRSNGGDCIVEYENPSKTEAVVRFVNDDVRSHVLEKKVHKLDLQKKGTIQLTVKLPQDVVPQEYTGGEQDMESVRKRFKIKEEPAESSLPKEQKTISIILPSDEIEDDHLQLYFENKRSRGGPIASFTRERREIKITFENAQDAEAVLSQAVHSVENIPLTVRKFQAANNETYLLSSSVVLENLSENVTCQMLTLLVENFTELTEESDGFSLEKFSENAAVVTFKTNIDITEFIKRCSTKKLYGQFITPRQLELTKHVRVENLPSIVNEEFLQLYFERPQNGCAIVTAIELISEDSAAIISFQNYEVLETIFAGKHIMNKVPVYIYPYYKSLGSALYGNKRPMVKMPDPFIVDIDIYVLQFLRNDQHRIAEINEKMSKLFCQIAWPELDQQTSIKISPTFSGQKSLLEKHVKKWQITASETFCHILLKYQTIENDVNLQIWEEIKEKLNQSLNSTVSVITNPSKGKMILVGEFDSVTSLQEIVTSMMNTAIEKLEREKQSLTEMLSISSAVYCILKNDDLEQNLSMIYPSLSMNYNMATGEIKLYGLASEVYGAKSNILEGILHLKRRRPVVNLQLLSFLQRINHDEASCCLFTSSGINATYEIEDGAVVLIGTTEASLAAAEEQIKSHLNFKSIEVQDISVMKKNEWKCLIDELVTKLNASQENVSIEEIPLDKSGEVIVSGYSLAVMEVFEVLSDFVQQNTIIEKSIPFKSSTILTFLKEVKKMDLFYDEAKMGVKIEVHNAANVISVSGPVENVGKVETLLSAAISRLTYSVLKITKPGAKKFFEDKESYVDTVMSKFSCVLRLSEHHVFAESNGSHQACCQVQLPNGPLVALYQADLCNHSVDVIVNAANEDLQHIGGLAGALLKAAGPVLQKVCDSIIKDKGKLEAGDAVITEAGKLPCSYVIHAVGPRWIDFDPETAKKRLKIAVMRSLNLAETYNLQSIAIPAISSGIFGFPLPLCAEIIVSTIREYWENSGGGSVLKQIHLVNHDEKQVCAVSNAVQKLLGEYLTRSTPQPKKLRIPNVRRKNVEVESPRSGNVRSLNKLHVTQTIEGLNIIVVQGNIQEANTDIIVNTIGPDLDLNSGAVSRAILGKAGPKLQQLLFAEGQGGKGFAGCIYQTKGCNLGCIEVLHVVAPQWDQGNGPSKKVLINIIKGCLNIAETSQLESISFPAIGTGNLCFPRDVVAKLMFEQVLTFNRKYLKEVHFVVHPDDASTVQAMSDEFRRRFDQHLKSTFTVLNTTSVSELKQEHLLGSTSLASGEMKIGQVLLQVVHGDITKETTDVIVNSTNNHFTLKAGVSKAILDAAGQTVEDECALQGLQGKQRLIMTKAGNLQCKNIIHIVGGKDPNQIQDAVQIVLQECERNQFSSVAFPAFGTGQGGMNPSQVADAMVKSVAEFASKISPAALHRIRFVIFQPQLLTEFHSSMRKQQDSNLGKPKTFWEKGKNAIAAVIWGNKNKENKEFGPEDFVLENTIEPVVMEICGEDAQNVEKSISWIEKVFEKEHSIKTINSEFIFHFTERERAKLKNLMENHQITIEMEQSGPQIRVCGLHLDVLTVYSEIQEMVNEVRDKLARQRDEALVNNLVEWQFRKGGQFQPVDRAANFNLESAFIGKASHIELEIEHRKYTVELKTCTATDNHGNSIQLNRASKSKDELPPHWDDMAGQQFKSVALQQSTLEYQRVETLFKNTCSQFQIIQIERLQNPFLWKNYIIKKQYFHEKNPNGTKNEHVLFHGTAPEAKDSISNLGFNRSYAGKNATTYGTGTYFAVNASYSASNTYSKPDSNGVKYIYQACVLTGVYCQGKNGMLIPPPKNPNNLTDLYDSVVDRPNAPSMFIIFNDIQAYPEYLISFK